MKLTDEELEVLKCMAEGLRPKQIMGRLAISRRTYVRRHQAIKDKFGAVNDLQIGMIAERRRRVQSGALQ